MLITYFRSSSYNAHDDCEQRYYLEYVLGWKGPSNLKADRGSIVHKILEILAILKKAHQDGQSHIEDDHIGKMKVTLKPNIEKLTEKVFGHYTNLVNHHNWSGKDLDVCQELVEKAITFNDGMYNPLKREIIAPELHFDFPITAEWAKYTYTMPDNSTLAGQLALKGTVDLITKPMDDVYEIIDWKTGRRLNWATGEEKTYEKLQDDPQLRLYHYAVSNLFPEVEQIMITIFFIADGGPFSICYTKDDLPKTEEMIRKKFEIIRRTQVPKLNKTWKCKRLCPFNNILEHPHVKNITEFRKGELTPIGQQMSLCELIKFEVNRKGMARTTQEYTNPEHNIGFYKKPGEI